jgi:predicted  nucleic acid-binding Zn-ribbon protein
LEYDDTTVDDVKDFARQLERELNAANDRIKRLEEAGDRAIENSYYPDRVKVWNKAKEAKP